MRAWWERNRPWIILALALVYDVVPVDLIPDAPVVGWIDDLGVTGAAILLAATWRRRGREADNPAIDAADDG